MLRLCRNLLLAFLGIYLSSCSSSSSDNFQEVIFESRGPSDFVSDVSKFEINGSNCPSIKTFSLPNSATVTGFSTSYVVQGGEGPAGIGQTRDQVSFFRFYSGDELLAQSPVAYGPDSEVKNLNYSNSLKSIVSSLFGFLSVRYSSATLLDIHGNSIADILAGHTNVTIELHVGRTRLLDDGIHFRWDPECIVIGGRVECPFYSCCCDCLYLLPRDQPDDTCDVSHQSLVKNEWISRLFYTE